MSIRTWIIETLVRSEDLEWLVEELKPDAIECVATGETQITWTDRNNRKEKIQWMFYKNTITGLRSYEYHSYGLCEDYDSHKTWEGVAKKYVATGIIPDWAEAVDFEMMKNNV